jgi:hypothetical protein
MGVHFLHQERPVIPELRARFNHLFAEEKYTAMLRLLEQRCGSPVEFRVAETPIFVPASLLQELSAHGANLARSIIANPQCLNAARNAIPAGYRVANETAHPSFLTADFALVRDAGGALVPRLVEIQAFPSVYGYQAELCSAYREVYNLDENLGVFLEGLNEESYWELLARTIVAGHDPENVVLTELDPLHQKTLPDFKVTARRLGIAVVDIRSLEPSGDRLHYRNASGRLVPIHRIYNRAIADELIGKRIQLPFNLEREWNVEWAGHPNWYFLISKFSIPWLSSPVVPPAVFLNHFINDHSHDDGCARLAEAGVPLPKESGPATVYNQLLLKPLFSFAGKGIEFAPSRQLLESIPPAKRPEFLLQQRMNFEPTIDTPCGLTQAEIRILYAWPDRGALTPALSLVRLGRGKMMGVDHNRDLRWVGASAAFFPKSADPSPAP